MIAAGLTINPRRSNYVEFIGPIVEDTVGILVKPSTANYLFFQMFHLFQINVWIAITSSVVILGTTVWLFNRYSPFSGWNLQLPEANSNEVSLSYNIWISLRCMLLQENSNVEYHVSVNNTFYESIYRKLVANPVSVYSTDEAVKLVIKSNNYVYITERLFLMSVLQSEECSNLEVIEEPGIVAALGFAVQLGKEYAKPMSS
ncbi:unnamed protein product [Schistosoma mattheei]|uniref:Uncharacterized protein n=1 Tax=Schistosoma mattheei TaxID=31246 RepID=A0A183PIQ9_9TREM|nr:unnamed protein product [Schistosoma mattheei]